MPLDKDRERSIHCFPFSIPDQAVNQHPENLPDPEDQPEEETLEDTEELHGELTHEEELPEEELLTPELVEDEAIRGDFVLRWALILLAFLVSFTEISESQTLVRIRTGQHIIQNGFLPPADDVFSYSASDQPWVNLSWLYDVILAATWSVAGFSGVTFLKAAIVASAFYLISRISVANVSTWWATICGTLALIACYPQFTAQPEIVTMLGVSLTLYLLFQWRITEYRKYLVGLVLFFLFWANLDPRMFLGLLILIFFALGYLVDQFSGRLERFKLDNVLHIGLAVIASILIVMIHPFGWNTHFMTGDLYSKIYPAIYESLGSETGIYQLQFGSLFNSRFWRPFNPHSLASLILVLSAVITFYLNRKNFQFSSFFTFLIVLLFACMGAHEVAALSLTSAVIATLNAQQWYKVNFRQTYSIDPRELLFSRGGRAVTVVILFVIAYMGIAGSLAGSLHRRIGIGIHPELENYITSYEPVVNDSYDDRPFNFRPVQGDILIWHGQKVFIDNRMEFYALLDPKFLKEYQDVRYSLLRKVKKDPLSLEETAPVHPEQGNAEIWKNLFDNFKVTHVLPRLQGSHPDYNTFRDLVLNPDWVLTRVTASTAMFFRKDTEDDELKEYLSKNRMELIEKVFRSEENPALIPRSEFARVPDSYTYYLSKHLRLASSEEAEADHYYFLLDLLMNASKDPYRNHFLLPLAYHIVHKSNESLENNPGDADVYRTLGGAYYYIGRIESAIATRHQSVYETRRRFLQTIQAFRQSLTLNPDQPNVLKVQGDLYLQHQKYDLALDSYKRVLELLSHGNQQKYEEGSLTRLTSLTKQLEEMVNQTLKEIHKRIEKNPNPVVEAQLAYQKGCVLHARDLILNHQEEFLQSPDLSVFQTHVMMETGDLEKAHEIATGLDQYAQQSGIKNWSSQLAYSSLALADYSKAIQIWKKEAERVDQDQVYQLINHFPLVSFQPTQVSANPWPLNQIVSSAEALYQTSESSSSHRFNAALSCLEAGQNKEAEKYLREILDQTPETPLRPLVRYYLILVSGEEVELLPPSERIPIDAETFYQEGKKPVSQETEK